MRPTEIGIDALDLAVSATMMKQPKLDLRHTPGDPFSPSRAEAAYRKLGFQPRWLNDEGRVDRHLGQTLSILVNGMTVVVCPDGLDECNTMEWLKAPRFIDGQGTVTYIFAGVGRIPKCEILGKFTVESFTPCPESFERTMGSFMAVPPWGNRTWIQEPAKRDRLPVLPASIRFELARLQLETAS